MNMLIGILLSEVIFFSFSLSFSIIKMLSNTLSPDFLVGIRMLIVGLAGFFIFKKSGRNIYSRKLLLGVFLAGFFGHYLSNYIEVISIQQIPLYVGSIIYSLTPCITGIISRIVLNEKLNNYQILGIVISVISIVYLSISQQFTHTDIKIIPVILMFIAMILACYAWVQTRNVELSNKKNSFMLINSLTMLVAGISGIVFSCLNLNIIDNLSIIFINRMVMYQLIATIILSNIIAVYLYGALLKRFSATLISMIGMTSFPITGFFGALFFGETIDVETIIVYLSICVGTGIYILYEPSSQAKSS